ncbi:hypothetical protein ACWGQT_15985 [Streptomyces yangpuensis]
MAITWEAVEASLPAELRFGASGLLLFVIFLGIPSILISFIYGLASRHTGIAFRGRLAGLLFLPLWFLLALPPLLPVYAMGQLVFALGMMRTPLMGPPRLRRQARAALAAAARRAQALASRIGRVAPEIGTSFVRRPSAAGTSRQRVRAEKGAADDIDGRWRST